LGFTGAQKLLTELIERDAGEVEVEEAKAAMVRNYEKLEEAH
jgi:hypothetical protein